MSHNSKGLSELITKEFLIEHHIEKGMSLREIGRLFNCDKNNIRKYMKKYGLESNTSLKYNQYNRKYIYDDSFFEIIDSEEKAYWLGFIMADGYTYHSKKQKRLRIGLGKLDESHLSKFINSLNSNLPIQYDKGNPYVDVNSTKMCDDLFKLGIFPGKSNKESIPNIPDNLIRHFIRGLFDGDGSWILTEYSNCQVMVFNLVSSYQALLQIRTIMESHGIKFPKKSLYEIPGIWSLVCKKREDVLKIINFLYRDSSIFLNRKYDKALGFVNYKSKRLTKEDAYLIRDLYKSGHYTQTDLSKKFNTTISNIGHIINSRTFNY